jgi:sugar phosphate isomerase/epimerase
MRQAAVACVTETFDLFTRLDVHRVNVHIVACPHLFRHTDCVRWNGESFAQLAERAAPYGLQIMVEHPPSARFSLDDIGTILAADARLGFHLDVGHAHVGRLDLQDILERLGTRLVHVHMSDNRGHADEHLPLGAGTIDWTTVVRQLKQSGYDDTITLEVFSSDRDYLLSSAQKVRAWWQAAT